MPLIVLALFGFSQLIEALQREAERQLARKREPWRQAVVRQRNVVELAQKRINDSLEKSKEASQALGKSWKEVKTAGGKREFHADQAAMQKLQGCAMTRCSGRSSSASMSRSVFASSRVKGPSGEL